MIATPSQRVPSLLPRALRWTMEGLFGADFSSVRVLPSLPLLEPLGLRALAVGELLCFAPGAWQPETAAGREVLAHELTHVLQLRDRPAENRSRLRILDHPEFEEEARRTARAIAAGRPTPLRRHSAPTLWTPSRDALPIKTSIATNAGSIQANDLLHRLDQAVALAQQHLVVVPNADRTGPVPVFTMDQPGHWLWAAGRLAITGQNQQAMEVPCRLLIGANGTAVDIVDSSGSGNVWAERVHFPGNRYAQKRDLNYEQVANEFTVLFAGMDDRYVAREMLLCMMGQNPLKNLSGDQDRFLAGMVALLFGVEASRFASSLATSLMLLDLIFYAKTYGRQGTKRFRFARAFHSTHWDDGQWYGGKYPYAVHGTGSGNMRARQQMAVPGPNQGLMMAFAGLTQRHAVPRREVTLFIHWLESHFSDPQIGLLTANEVQEKLRARLAVAYASRELPAPFTHSPRANTGVHVAPYTQPGVVYFFQTGNYYHANANCKTFPGRYLQPMLYVAEFPVAPNVWQRYLQGLPLNPGQQRYVDRFLQANQTVQATGQMMASQQLYYVRYVLGKQPCPECNPPTPAPLPQLPQPAQT